jgi:hypothetical protein
MTHQEKIDYINSKETISSINDEYYNAIFYKRIHIHTFILSIIFLFIQFFHVYFLFINPITFHVVLTFISFSFLLISRRMQVKYWFFQKLYFLSCLFINDLKKEVKINIAN